MYSPTKENTEKTENTDSMYCCQAIKCFFNDWIIILIWLS